MKIHVKRIYEKASDEDGFRVLVDRLWPRGIKKENVKIDLWLKDIAPSKELRKWFGHKPEKWDEFKEKYFHELKLNSEGLSELKKLDFKIITLVYSAKEKKFNNAVALKEFIETKFHPKDKFYP